MSDDGSIHAVTQNPAVPISTQKDFLNWKRTGLCDEDVVDRLRPRTVPAGYPYHKWTQDAGEVIMRMGTVDPCLSGQLWTRKVFKCPDNWISPMSETGAFTKQAWRGF